MAGRAPPRPSAVHDASEVDPAARSPLPPTRDFGGDPAAAALYAGRSVEHVTAVVPAAQVVRALVRDAERALRDATVDR
jgi:hypothetical protein